MPKVGDRYHRLQVVEVITEKRFLLECDCGNKVTLFLCQLLVNNKSCGCLNREKRIARLKTHGDSKTKLYTVWKNMKARCYNKNSPHYQSYGGRGILVFELWKQNFEAFKVWAISNGYRGDLSIDRIDADRDYEPNNCRWITVSENSLLMNKYHIKNKTGPHSEEAKRKVKLSNRKNNGLPITLVKGEITLKFESIGEAAEYFSKLLKRKRNNVYSHLKQVSKGYGGQIGGWGIETNT